MHQNPNESNNVHSELSCLLFDILLTYDLFDLVSKDNSSLDFQILFLQYT